MSKRVIETISYEEFDRKYPDSIWLTFYGIFDNEMRIILNEELYEDYLDWVLDNQPLILPGIFTNKRPLTGWDWFNSLSNDTKDSLTFVKLSNFSSN